MIINILLIIAVLIVCTITPTLVQFFKDGTISKKSSLWKFSCEYLGSCNYSEINICNYIWKVVGTCIWFPLMTCLLYGVFYVVGFGISGGMLPLVNEGFINNTLIGSMLVFPLIGLLSIFTMVAVICTIMFCIIYSIVEGFELIKEKLTITCPTVKLKD